MSEVTLEGHTLVVGDIIRWRYEKSEYIILNLSTTKMQIRRVIADAVHCAFWHPIPFIDYTKRNIIIVPRDKKETTLLQREMFDE